jgi:phosphatidylglycerol:prolipoprotein diacylglycerol transferase
MHPTIFQVGPITVYSYGLLVAAGFIIGAFLAARHAPKMGLSPDKIINLALIILLSGILGSRILYVLLNLRDYLADPLEVIMLTHGGLIFYGGALAAFLAAIIYVKSAGLPLMDTADLLAPFIALGHAVGRIGCLLNGCCYGKLISGWRIPTQACSSLLLLCLFIFLRARLDSRKFAGQVFYLYLILYSAGRIVMEFLRGDSQAFLMGLTFSQAVSAVIFIIALSAYTIKGRTWSRARSG